MITSLTLFVFFSYGHFSRFFDDKLFIRLSDKIILGPDKIFIPVLLLLCAFVVYRIIRTKNSLDRVISFLNISLLFIVVCILAVIIYKEGQKNNPAFVYLNSARNNSIVRQVNTPDIYYIILDGYARQDTLKNVYNHDNSNFINSLRKMGFYVADNSRTNYFHTFLSLPSTLNMTYLDMFSTMSGKRHLDESAGTNLMFGNQVSEKLKNYGYKTINFETWWSGTNENYPADISYRYEKNYKILGLDFITSESNMVFLQTTLLNPLIREVRNEVMRGQILTVFEKLPDISYLEGRKFTLAHITSPHPPYIFTADGGEVLASDLNTTDEGISKRKSYVDQLIFISDQITQVLQKIIASSNTPPIIILQSDHGPASILGERQDWKTNFNKQGIDERSGILNAIYFPDRDYRQFYSAETPVNTFRIVFNKYFGQDMELLPDKTYYTDYDNLYQFIDVTD